MLLPQLRPRCGTEPATQPTVIPSKARATAAAPAIRHGRARALGQPSKVAPSVRRRHLVVDLLADHGHRPVVLLPGVVRPRVLLRQQRPDLVLICKQSTYPPAIATVACWGLTRCAHAESRPAPGLRGTGAASVPSDPSSTSSRQSWAPFGPGAHRCRRPARPPRPPRPWTSPGARKPTRQTRRTSHPARRPRGGERVGREGAL